MRRGGRPPRARGGPAESAEGKRDSCSGGRWEAAQSPRWQIRNKTHPPPVPLSPLASIAPGLYRPWPPRPPSPDPEEAQSPPPLPLPPPACAYHPPLPVNINPVAPPPLTCAQQPGQLCALLRLQVCFIGGAESGPERYTQRGRERLGSRGWMDDPLLAGLNTPLLLPQRRRTNLLCG